MLGHQFVPSFLITYFCNFAHVFRCIYTGTVEVTTDIAQDLLRAADQYLLEGLKRLCEYAIAQVWFSSFSVHASQRFVTSATSIRFQSCLVFVSLLGLKKASANSLQILLGIYVLGIKVQDNHFLSLLGNLLPTISHSFCLISGSWYP